MNGKCWAVMLEVDVLNPLVAFVGMDRLLNTIFAGVPSSTEQRHQMSEARAARSLEHLPSAVVPMLGQGLAGLQLVAGVRHNFLTADRDISGSKS